VDIFGNITTDLPSASLQNRTDILFRLQGTEIKGISVSYGEKQPGELVAVIDSEEFVEIAVVNGNAAQELKAKVGDEIEVIYNR
jgi:S-adenosylmethionine hydrolase